MSTTWSVCYHPVGMGRDEDAQVIVNCDNHITPVDIVADFERAGAVIKWIVPIPHVHMEN